MEQSSAPDLSEHLAETPRGDSWNQPYLPGGAAHPFSIIEAAPDCIITFNSETEILEFNAASEQTFGYERSEIIGRSLSELILHRTNDEPPWRIFDRPVEACARRVDGTEFPAEIFVKNLRQHEPPLFAAFLRDITERKREVVKRELDERKIRQSEANLALAQRVAHIGSWEVDVTTRSERANHPPRWSDETFRIFGLEPGSVQITHESFFQLLHPSERTAAREAFLHQIRTGTPYSANHRVIRQDGSERILHVESDTVHDEDGHPIRLGGTVRDITREQRVRAALQMQAHVIAHMAEGVIIADEEGRITATNPAFDRMFGYEPNELYGRPVSVLDDPNEAETEKLAAKMLESIRRDSIWKGELHRRRKDGTPLITRTQVSAFEMDGKRHYFAVQEDLTASKQTEKALAGVEQKYRSLFENAVEGIFQSVPFGKFTDANPAMARILGYDSPEELMQQPSDIMQKIYVDPRDRDEFRRQIEQKGFVNGFEAEVYRKDGSIIWGSASARAVRNAQGEILYIEGFLKDITERKGAEAQIREQAKLLNLAHDAIVVRNLQDEIELWNCGAAKIFGWSTEETLGKPVTEFMYADVSVFAEAKAELLKTGDWHGELQHYCKDGHRITTNSRLTLVRDENGSPKSVLGIHTDITAQKKLEAQFLRTQRLESIGTLAAGVAHDLNNVLAPILLISPLLQGEIDAEDKEKFLELVQASAERGAGIVKQMLTFARGADGEQVLLQPIYLIEEIAKIAEQTFPKSIAIRTRYPESVRPIQGDPTQLHQVLLNLCVNARDAMPNGGSLTIAVSNYDVDEPFANMMPGAKPGPHVLLEVIDNGVGIPGELLDKIFDPFFTTKEVGQGSGLGLSAALGIVRSHSGFINVYSEPGNTSLKVFLPAIAGAESQIGTPKAPMLPAGRGEIILVVEDEATIRESAEIILTKFGYSVLLASDGIEALAIFAKRSKEIALVLTDLVMPVMDGITFVRTIRKMEPSIKVIISTGRDGECRPAELDSLNVSACLTKPYTQEKLLTTLADMLQPTGSQR